MRLLLLCMAAVILCLVGVIQAAPTTNATTTSEYSEALSFTNRTLWNIISSSILTLFACIYSAVHPNIPSPKDSLFRILWRRLGIMIMALIAPELIVTWAMRQWISARHVTKRFKKSGYFNVPRLQTQSENHELAGVLAGPVGDDNRAQPLVAPAEVSTSRYGGTRVLAKPFKKLFEACISDQSEDYAWTQTHSFFVLMGGFMLYVDGEPYRTLLPDDVLKLIPKGCIDAPTLTAKRIRDKSKGNVISKGLMILQVVWFILQLITRAIYHLETTQLETGTLAFAVLNFLTYAVWWNKPLDVQCPHPVYWKSTESKPEDHIDAVSEDDSDEDERTMYKIIGAAIVPFVELMGFGFPPRKLRVPTFDGSIELEKSDKRFLIFAGILMATTFGGIHCMAWFFTFPTNHEQVLWRMSAVAITCTPCLEILWYEMNVNGAILVNYTMTIMPAIVIMFLCVVALIIFALLYITSRAMLLVLMVTTLRNLPVDAYTTAFVPHL
ncbi:hypothetical protein DEU56DRAFT_59263 [Suillus clintonianus]|uniref:uncharacterized protein n=1 Tax=Suillus clintonianus TaxID=1904413 RepID=UPI001B86B97F|nr:uncharacterized protein DEU56DRAFT_59263 [Suillus clintonianus]KAG2149309.1 hypothetical protein DEU56DRAFT_59263 [Suillus clintonianus]